MPGLREVKVLFSLFRLAASPIGILRRLASLDSLCIVEALI